MPARGVPRVPDGLTPAGPVGGFTAWASLAGAGRAVPGSRLEITAQDDQDSGSGAVTAAACLREDPALLGVVGLLRTRAGAAGSQVVLDIPTGGSPPALVRKVAAAEPDLVRAREAELPDSVVHRVVDRTWSPVRLGGPTR